MVICHYCGVELEAGMTECPLCGNPVNSALPDHSAERETGITKETLLSPHTGGRPNHWQRKNTWEVVTVILLSITLATGIINLIINKQVTWAVYPAAICLIIFAYVSVFTFWPQRTVMQISGGFVTACVFLLTLQVLSGRINWVLSLAIPLLLVLNLILAGLLIVIQRSKQKGINLIAYGFLATALLCVGIEAVLDYYATRQVEIWWSGIVGACVLPVFVTLLFMHFRFKKGRDLQKTFHI